MKLSAKVLSTLRHAIDICESDYDGCVSGEKIIKDLRTAEAALKRLEKYQSKPRREWTLIAEQQGTWIVEGPIPEPRFTSEVVTVTE